MRRSNRQRGGKYNSRSYGWYSNSNKKRGLQEKKSPKSDQQSGMPEPDTPFRRRCRMTWAVLIKLAYEVDPLKCPRCGGTMWIVGFIEEAATIREDTAALQSMEKEAKASADRIFGSAGHRWPNPRLRILPGGTAYDNFRLNKRLRPKP